ncbi:MAG: biopolymer transporter ExbD [Pseudomonadota bacterium]
MQPNRAISLGEPRRQRRPSLTPMIDVVFLLLVFFMLAARFGLDNAIPLSPAMAGGGTYEGAPRLITVGRDAVRLNGSVVAPEDLTDKLVALMPSTDAIVVLRAEEDATLQELVDVMDRLSAAGIQRVVVAE